MTSQDTKEPKGNPDWNFICEQIGKERFTPKRNHHFGVNLTENRHRRKKEDAKTQLFDPYGYRPMGRPTKTKKTG